MLIGAVRQHVGHGQARQQDLGGDVGRHSTDDVRRINADQPRVVARSGVDGVVDQQIDASSEAVDESLPGRLETVEVEEIDGDGHSATLVGLDLGGGGFQAADQR